MSRKIVRLTLDNLEALPSPCRSCLFWERDPVRRSRAEDPAAEKDAWVSHVLREWGSCGRVALVDDVPVGYLVYAPEAFVPGRRRLPDRAGLAGRGAADHGVRRTRAARGGGLGRMLVQGMARDLIKRDIKAVEAFGDTRGKGTSRACCRWSSSAASASRPNGRTPPRRGCGWSSGPRSPGGPRWRRRWSGSWVWCARRRRPPRAEGHPLAAGGLTDSGLTDVRRCTRPAR